MCTDKIFYDSDPLNSIKSKIRGQVVKRALSEFKTSSRHSVAFLEKYTLLQAALNFSHISIKLKIKIKNFSRTAISWSPEAGCGNCLPYA